MMNCPVCQNQLDSEMDNHGYIGGFKWLYKCRYCKTSFIVRGKNLKEAQENMENGKIEMQIEDKVNV